MDNEATLNERVLDGALWLDNYRPGWAAEIDTDELRMQSACNCVLGQLDGGDAAGYYQFLKKLAESQTGAPWGLSGYVATEAWSQDHGFTINEDIWPADIEDVWGELRDYWQDRIAERIE